METTFPESLMYEATEVCLEPSEIEEMDVIGPGREFSTSSDGLLLALAFLRKV